METKDILKQLRKEKGLTVTEVAQGADISESVYPKYESGVRNIGIPALEKLADFYGVTTDYLLGRVAEPIDFSALTDEQIDDILIQTYRNAPDELRAGFRIGFRRTLSMVLNGELPKKEEPEQSEPSPIKKLVRHEATLKELEEEQAAADARAKKNVG